MENRKKKTTVLVTVGSTKFDALIDAINHRDVVRMLESKGYRKLLLQIGSSMNAPLALCPESHRHHGTGTHVWPSGFQVEWFEYAPSLSTIIEQCGLVISHAGSGSIFESLHAGSALITVPNETLMDNHQAELAHQLEQEGYVMVATPATLMDVLERFDASMVKTYIPQDGSSIARRIEEACV